MAKRNTHTYKCTDKVYSNAMKRAKKEKKPLSNMMEEVIEAYADGAFTVHFLKPLIKKTKPTDPEPTFKRWDDTDNY